MLAPQPQPEAEGAGGIRTDDAGVVAGELRRYLNAALYLDENRSASGRYRFTSEPNVRRMVNDRKDRFRTPNFLADRVKDALMAEYSAPRGKSDALGLKVYPGKNDNAADDRNQCQLAVMPADYFNWRNAQAHAHILAELYEWRSGGNDPRQHKNAIVFLVADNNDLSVLQEQIVTRAAGEALKQENLNLPARQRQLLDEIIAQAGKDVSQAVQNKWTHLFYPGRRRGLQSPGSRAASRADRGGYGQGQPGAGGRAGQAGGKEQDTEPGEPAPEPGGMEQHAAGRGAGEGRNDPWPSCIVPLPPARRGR